VNIRAVGSVGGLNALRGDGSARRSPAPSSGASFSFKSKDSELIFASLKNLLFRRYDTDSKILNLSGILDEPETVEVLSSKSNTMSKLFAVFSAICDEAFPTKEARKEGVTGILLGGNKFVSLLPARSLAWEFPEVLNLDVSNNNIQSLDGLNNFRKCTKLRHIILSGNPWEEHANFKRDLLKAFPNLQMIDGVAITTVDRELVQQDNRAAPAILQGFFADATGLGQKFFQNFFVGFDGDRKALVDYYYDKNSTFSYAINTRALKDPSIKGTTGKNEWDNWIWDSRNLTKLQNHNRKNRLHKG
jgi:nuclear RNA export factor